MKIDPYKHKERYLAWKEKVKDGIPGLSKYNSDLTLQYLNDMEKGINIAKGSSKGSRSYIRLNTLREKICSFSMRFKEVFGIDNVTDIKEEQLISFFSDMKNGVIKRLDGKDYLAVENYSRVFKAFWHWYQKINRRKDIEIKDITQDLDTRQDKPKWVYLTEDQVRTLCNSARFDYKVLFMFLFDTGIRSPTELLNVKVSDFYNDFKELNIRDETSKTFGRRIKLMLSSDLIREFVKMQNLSKDDCFINMRYEAMNKYLKRLTIKLFGEGTTDAGGKYSEISLYDFRHISCCYWLPRYKSESALKYRFGWKKSDKIHYYSEMLGMKDTIQEEDLLVDITKTEIERKLERAEKDKELMQDRLQTMEMQMQKILELTSQLNIKVIA